MAGLTTIDDRLVQLGRQPAPRRRRRRPRPPTVEDVAEAVRAAAAAGPAVKAVGSGHSFTAVALTDGRADGAGPAGHRRPRRPGRPLVTVPAGMTLRALNDLLAAHGLALPNLGDIDAQTDRRRALHRHPRHRRRRTAACPPSSRRSPWSPAPARCCAARPTSTRTSSPPPGSASARSASLIEVTLRCVRRLHAARPRTPGAAGRRAGRAARR